MFVDPKKRICFIYLISALVIGVFWGAVVQRKPILLTFKNCLSLDIWWSKSARLDYLLMFVNKIYFLLISNIWLSSTVVTFFIYEGLHAVSPAGLAIEANKILVVALFTVSIFIIDDFTKYLVHWSLHNVPVLWVFHKVHHSATCLTPFTIFRTHPVEMLIFSARSIIVRSSVIAIFIFIFGDLVDLYTVLGVNIGLFAFNIIGSNLRHSHVYLKYWDWLELWLISPAQHQIHHSRDFAHHGKNLGVVLAIWDRLGGTLFKAPSETTLAFGFGPEESASADTIEYAYITSFKEAAMVILRPLKRKGHLRNV